MRINLVILVVILREPWTCIPLLPVFAISLHLAAAVGSTIFHSIVTTPAVCILTRRKTAAAGSLIVIEAFSLQIPIPSSIPDLNPDLQSIKWKSKVKVPGQRQRLRPRGHAVRTPARPLSHFRRR